MLLERRDLRCFEKCRIGMYVVRKFKHGGRRGLVRRTAQQSYEAKANGPKHPFTKTLKKAILYGVSHKQTMGQQIANKTNSF